MNLDIETNVVIMADDVEGYSRCFGLELEKFV